MEEKEDVIASYRDVASLAITYSNLDVGTRFVQPQLVPLKTCRARHVALC
jgi:hypothetical protein